MWSYDWAAQGGGGGAVDPWADIPRILHLAADQEDVADGYALATLADRSGVGQDLTTAGDLTYDADGGPGGAPCYVFPSGAYATRLDPTLPQGTASPGYGLLAVVYLTDLSGYPQIMEIGLENRDGDGAHHNFQQAVASTGALYSANTGGDSERLSTAGVVTTNTWVLVGWRVLKGYAFGADNPVFYVNGSAVSSASGTGTSTPSLSREALRVGRSLYSPSSEQNLKGRLAELVLIPTDDSDAFDLAALILVEKYGL